jgi:putative glycosyltransferase (TIGR04348 family)
VTDFPDRRINDVDFGHRQLFVGEIGNEVERSLPGVEQHGPQFDSGEHVAIVDRTEFLAADAMMPTMRIRIVCPAPPGTLYGNRISAERWARILRQLGHRVAIDTSYDRAPCDLLIALHAKRSAQAVFDFAEHYPHKPVIVVLTGTDIYHDIHRYRSAQRALEAATRLVVLQPLATEELARHLRPKARVIYQSVDKTRGLAGRCDAVFQVAVVGHLRNIKDPFRAPMAVRSLPAASRIRVVHAGAAMTEQMARRAQAEERRNSRYCWLGEIPRWGVRRLIASSHLLVLSSKMEGGANVISEAVVDGTPVLASRIPGSIGLLGADYPGLYPFEDTDALRNLLLRAEADCTFYSKLLGRGAKLSTLFRPARERASWRDLITEL